MSGERRLYARSRLRHSIDLRLLATAIDAAARVECGLIPKGLLSELERRRFDQAPVTRNRRIVGMVTIERLRTLDRDDRPLAARDEGIRTDRLAFRVPITVLLEAMFDVRGVLVLNPKQRVHGFITLSDLNGHAVRAALYPMFAELEASIADLVRRLHRDDWACLRHLDREREARLIGHWELAKRDNVETDPLAAATLHELSEVAAGSSGVREGLGFASKGHAKRSLERIIGVRNSIMHPVKPLISSGQDVRRVHGCVSDILAMLDRMSSPA